MTGKHPEAHVQRIAFADNDPGSPLARFVVWSSLLFFLVVVAGTIVLHVDQLVVASGRVTRSSEAVIVQVAESGVIKQLLVEEGDVVSVGTVLAVIGREVADSDLQRVQREESLLRLQLRRVAAEISGQPFRIESEDAASESYDAIQQLFASNQAAFAAAVSSVAARIDEAESDMEAASHRVAELELLNAGQEDEIRRIESATTAGLLPQAELREMKRQAGAMSQRLQGERQSLLSSRARLAQERGQVDSLHTSRRQELEAEHVEFWQRLADVEAERVRISDIADRHEIRAPIAGVVQDIAIASEGAVAASGVALLTIVPTTGTPAIESWVENEDIAKLRVGMEARVKIHALNYQDFGLVPATLEAISPMAGEMPEQLPGAAATSELDQAMRARLGYKIKLSIDPALLPARLQHRVLPPGMLVSTEIVVGRRRVIEYLLSPVRRVIDESGREAD